MRHRTIWFGLLSLLLVSLVRAVSKYGKICIRRIKGARLGKQGNRRHPM